MRSLTILLVVLSLGAPASGSAQAGSPAGPVPTEMLTQRRERLLDRIGDGAVLLRSARVLDMEGEDYAQASDFRQDNDFFYLTGLETPNAWLLLVGHSDRPDEVVLYIQPRDETSEQWTGARLDTRSAASLSGIADVRTTDRAAREIGARLDRGGPLFVKLPQMEEQLCADLNGQQRLACSWLFLKPLPRAQVELRDIRPHMAALRLIKDEDELKRLRRAIAITDEAHRAAMRAARPGIWEYELEAAIEQTFHARGAERVGFPSIVGSGPNSTALHYDKSRRQTTAGDLIVIDNGAEFGYYTADVTRTIPVSGTFSARQRALYELVLGAQRAAIEAVKPGVTLYRLDEIARDYMRRNSGRLCGARTCDELFIHGLSHWLGMDVHDPGAVSTPLAAGMVLTVEPGLYIPKEGLGIRIEDDVLVTPTGHEVLSAAPRSVAEVEQAMAEKR